MNEPAGGILDQYHNISNKLKKWFWRKPNVTEACESFRALAKQCEEENMNAYAGMCWIAVARCEGSISNLPNEVACLNRSADQFLNCKQKDHYLGYESPSNENLQAALSCFAYSASRLPEKSALGFLTNMQIVETLGKFENASVERYLKDTLRNFQNSLEIKVLCLEKLGEFYISNGDYHSALENYANLYKLLENMLLNASKKDDLFNCELICLFLLLILKPTSQTLSSDLSKLLEKYTWGDSNDFMDKNLYILLQSLVLTCQSVDTSCLAELEGQLWKYLNRQQKDLLHILINMYY